MLERGLWLLRMILLKADTTKHKYAVDYMEIPLATARLVDNVDEIKISFTSIYKRKKGVHIQICTVPDF